LLIALGVAVFAMSQKLSLATTVKQRTSECKEAKTALDKANSRIRELERKLTRAKETVASKEDSSDDLHDRVAKLEDENDQLRKTMARTSARSTPAQLDRSKELTEQLQDLKRTVSDLTKQLDEAVTDRKYYQQQIDVVRETVEREAAGASEAYQSRVEAIVDRYQTMKKRLLEAERELRIAQRHSEHNHRAYRITLRQLDLVEDQLYVERSGKEPDNRKQRLMATMGLAETKELEEAPLEEAPLEEADPPLESVTALEDTTEEQAEVSAPETATA